jgi:hypothetical protein
MPVYTDRKIWYNLDSNELIPLGTMGPGTYLYRLDIKGNSLLSTLYVKSKDAGATISAEYYDVTTGENFGEETFLKTHLDIDAGETHRILISGLHNKPVLRLVIAGGDVEFSIFNTVLPSQFSAVDAALVFDAELFDVLSNKALPGAGLDDVNDVLRFFRVKPDGSLIVSSSPATPQNPYFRDYIGLTSPGTVQTLLNEVVPANTKRILTKVRVTTRQSGFYKILENSSIIGSGRLDPSKTSDTFTWEPNRSVSAGNSIKLLFETYAGRPVSDLEAYVMGYDEQV